MDADRNSLQRLAESIEEQLKREIRHKEIRVNQLERHLKNVEDANIQLENRLRENQEYARKNSQELEG